MLQPSVPRAVTAIWFAILSLTSSDARSQTLLGTKAFGRYQQLVWTDQHGLPQNTVRSILRTRDGYLWLATLEGAVRFDGVRFTVFDSGNTKAIGVSLILAMLEDRAGNLWLATDGTGIVRRAPDGIFTRFSTEEGLSNPHVMCLLEDRAGVLWVGTDGGGLHRLEHGRFTKQQGLPSEQIRVLAEDAQGTLWVATTAGLAQLHGGTVTSIGERDGLPRAAVRALLPDPQGGLWIGTDSGLTRLADGRVTNYDPTNGPPQVPISALRQDREGTLWIGTDGNGVLRLRDGHITSHTIRDGLPSDRIEAIYQDPEGDVWIGTDGSGVAQLRDGRMRAFSVNDGVPDNNVRTIIEDRDDARVSLNELNAVADGKASRVTSFVYGVADGMLSRECNVGSPAGWKTRDGRLWFATVKGVVTIDPKHRVPHPPLVAIEEVTVDQQVQPTASPIRLSPGQDNLEIAYTGLSWARPQYIAFKYKLAGLDAGWVQAGSRRTAYFTHLPPGDYTFTVIADNGEGVWNTEGKSLRIVVLPPFYRTRWFLTLTTLAMVVALTAGYQYRIRQLTRAKAAQQTFSRQLIASQEGERKRIAAELHDSLGQRLIIIKNMAMLFLNAPDWSQDARQQIEEISTEASHAIGEVKEIAYNLRPYQLDRIGLTKAVEAVVRTASAASTIAFSADIDDIDDVFPKDSEINFYRIVQEGVNNVLKHSAASNASITVKHDRDRLSLTIRDDGRGWTVHGPQPDGHRGGFGLVGISERAQLLGGTPRIHSVPGQGTTISMEVALRDGRHHA